MYIYVVDLNEMPDNRRDRALTEHLRSPNEVSSTRNRPYLIELWVKGFHGNYQTCPAIPKGSDASSQTVYEALLVKTTSTKLIENGKESHCIPRT